MPLSNFHHHEAWSFWPVLPTCLCPSQIWGFEDLQDWMMSADTGSVPFGEPKIPGPDRLPSGTFWPLSQRASLSVLLGLWTSCPALTVDFKALPMEQLRWCCRCVLSVEPGSMHWPTWGEVTLAGKLGRMAKYLGSSKLCSDGLT